MPLSPHLQPLFDTIQAAHPDGLSLDELSEELSTKSVSYADIDELIGALEEAGFDLEGPGATGRAEELTRVLDAVRALIAETGARPSAEAIAARAGLTPTAVRRALRLGRSAAP
ncbi:MAG TPA: sigma-70 domain-containing protein [Polyangia bacterium]|nr:sigma-70 domain-containing protein [Polyangia bacterium]